MTSKHGVCSLSIQDFFPESVQVLCMRLCEGRCLTTLCQRLNPVPATSIPIHQAHADKHPPVAHQYLYLWNCKDLLHITTSYKTCHSISLSLATSYVREQLSTPIQKELVVSSESSKYCPLCSANLEYNYNIICYEERWEIK